MLTSLGMNTPATRNGMRRRNLYLPDSLMGEVESYARTKGVSASDVVRSALGAYMRAVAKAREAARGTPARRT